MQKERFKLEEKDLVLEEYYGEWYLFVIVTRRHKQYISGKLLASNSPEINPGGYFSFENDGLLISKNCSLMRDGLVVLDAGVRVPRW